ncbi:MAG: DUF3108 domain-containing protein [Kiritimatiellia bacterium]|nr:DUF3108 domain-containing protein [Lentisphaerota bacterium]
MQLYMRYWWILAGLLLVGGRICSARPDEIDPAPRERPALWFSVGERLVYSVQWGILRVGEAVVWSEWVDDPDRDLLAIRVTARTVSFMDRIYPVDDFLESIVDAQTFLPLSFTKRLSEGRYRLHEITTFDHVAGQAHWKHLLREDSERFFEISSDTRDLLSFMFFMRSQPWEPGKHYEFQVMADEKVYDLEVNTRKYENIELPAFGKVRSLRLDPEAKFKGFFVRVAKVNVWLSDDARRLCTKARAGISLGTIQVVLQSVEGPGDDNWVMANRAE